MLGKLFLTTGYIFEAIKLYFFSALLLKLSTALGNSEAMSAYGNAYYFGRGVTMSYERAFVYYSKSANLGNRYGAANTAHMYYEGLFIDKDLDKAIYWYKIAASKGHKESIEMLEFIENL